MSKRKAVLADFKVGTIVWVEVAKDASTILFRQGQDIPRWNFGNDHGSTGQWMELSIRDSNPFQLIATCKPRNGDDWNMPLPGHPDWDDSRPGWYTPFDPTIKQEEITRPIFIPILAYTEDLGKNPSPKAQQLAVERAEKSVRRQLREWPYRQKLSHRFLHSDSGSVLETWWEEE